MSQEVTTLAGQEVSALASDAVRRLEQEGFGRIYKFLARHCIVIRVTASAAPKTRMLRSAEVTIEGKTISDDEIKKPGLILVPRKVDTELTRVSNLARRIPAKYGVSFAEFAYMVPMADGGDDSPVAKALREIQECEQRYQQVAEELFPEYEAHRLKMMGNENYQQLERYFLNRDAWIQAHRIRCDVFPLAGLPNDFVERVAGKIREYAAGLAKSAGDVLQAEANVIGGLAEQAAADASSMSFSRSLSTNAAWVETVNKAASRLAASAAVELAQAPIAEMTEALARFEEILDKGGTVRLASLERVRESFTKLQGFSFLMPQSRQAVLARLAARLDQTAVSDLSGAANANSAKGLAEYIRGIRKELEASEANSESLGEVCMMLDLS